VEIPDLVDLLDGTNYDLIGDTGSHPRNHFGTQTVLNAVVAIANAYHEQFPDDPILQINDISLPRGGLFDIGECRRCRFWDHPHDSHMAGRDVDIRTIRGAIPQVNREDFEDICRSRGAVPTLENPGRNNEHYHLDF
jgi:hypothetical protein